MAEILRYIVPPEVKAMQSELKTFMQNVIDGNYQHLEKAATEERVFLGQY